MTHENNSTSTPTATSAPTNLWEQLGPNITAMVHEIYVHMSAIRMMGLLLEDNALNKKGRFDEDELSTLTETVTIAREKLSDLEDDLERVLKAIKV